MVPHGSEVMSSIFGCVSLVDDCFDSNVVLSIQLGIFSIFVGRQSQFRRHFSHPRPHHLRYTSSIFVQVVEGIDQGTHAEPLTNIQSGNSLEQELH